MLTHRFNFHKLFFYVISLECGLKSNNFVKCSQNNSFMMPTLCFAKFFQLLKKLLVLDTTCRFCLFYQFSVFLLYSFNKPDKVHRLWWKKVDPEINKCERRKLLTSRSENSLIKKVKKGSKAKTFFRRCVIFFP